MSERDDLIPRIARELRDALPVSAAFDQRVMAQVALLPPHRRGRAGSLAAAWSWLRRPLTIRLSPLGGLALAAGLVVTVSALRSIRSGRPPARGMRESQVQFVFVAPGAASVSVVGDFNDWNPQVSPLRAARTGVWEISVPLAPGRHRYAFVVDGRVWRSDPAAPRALDDFGTPSSVVTVGG